MILSINVEKQNIVFVLLYLTKYNTFIMKTLDRLGIRRNIPPHNKGHILKKEALARAIKQDKELKDIQIEKV